MTDVSTAVVDVPEPVPERWEDWWWPDWVPEPVRAAVRGYWHDGRRGPVQWLADAKQRGAPDFGALVEVAHFAGSRTEAWGRYVHCHTNIGRVIHENGAVSLVFVLRGSVRWVKFVSTGKGGW